MPITLEEYEIIGRLKAEISVAYTLVDDLRWFGMQSSRSNLTECEIEPYDLLRKSLIKSNIEELERAVKEELIPEIRKYVKDYTNPFDPNELDDIPF